MEAIEFETTPKEGTIQIPEKYKAQFSARIRVVLLRETEADSQENPEARHQRGHRMAEALSGIAQGGDFPRLMIHPNGNATSEGNAHFQDATANEQ